MVMHRRNTMKRFSVIALISFVNANLTMAAAARESLFGSRRYAVVFDAGSTGSRVHVYCFGQNMELVPINGTDIEFAKKVKPGLSAYADNPEEAANSLKGLLESAAGAIPKAARSATPIRLGATAGLRQISEVKADKILAAVRALISGTTAFKFEEGWVSILEGSQEGSFMWITINYLLSNLGKSYPSTVGIVDLGGGSVQMAYAISEEQSKKAPKPVGDEPSHITEMSLNGMIYHIYVHSYLNYGLLAARGKILNVTMDKASPCVAKGYNGTYEYNGITYNSLAPASGSSFDKCRKVVKKALRIDQVCTYEKCTFGSIWNGGGGNGQKDIFLTSGFYNKATQVGVISTNLSNVKISLRELGKAAQTACKISYKDVHKKYPSMWTDGLPYVCMDLVYQYSLMVDGFGIKSRRNVTLVEGLEYNNYLVDASWALGGAIDLFIPSTKKYVG